MPRPRAAVKPRRAGPGRRRRGDPHGRRLSGVHSALGSRPPAVSRRRTAPWRRNSRCGTAGDPPHFVPAGTSFITPDWAAIWAPAPIGQMAGQARLAAEGGEIADHGRAGNAALRHQNAMAADDDVVGDLHQIVDLGPFADDRVAVGAAVDRRPGADLDVVLNDDAADLRHLEMPARPEREAEAVLADMDAGMDDDAVADQRADDRRLGADDGVAADAHAGADDRVGADQRAGADLRAGPDHRAGIDDDARLESRRRMDEGGGRNAGLAERRARPGRLRIEARHRLGHRPIGLRRDEQGAARRRLGGVARRDERRAGAGRAEGVEVARIVEEGQVVRARFVERRDVADDPVGVGAFAELRAGPLRDLAERRRGGERKKADLRHGPVVSVSRRCDPSADRGGEPSAAISLAETRRRPDRLVASTPVPADRRDPRLVHEKARQEPWRAYVWSLAPRGQKLAPPVKLNACNWSYLPLVIA